METRKQELAVPAVFSNLCGASLFSGAGIGDLGFRAAGVTFLAMCEVEEDRAALARLNFPEAGHFVDDIHRVIKPFCSAVAHKLAELQQELFLITCTAPCQGMSKSGQGTLLSNIRKGKRPKLDPRNGLILPALEIISALRPLWVVFENVIEMRNTVILDSDGRLRPILEIIEAKLQPDYIGRAYDVEFADYGIAQRRQRLITIYTRGVAGKSAYASGIPFVPLQTHAKNSNGKHKKWVSVTEGLAHFPPLDSKDSHSAECAEVPFHRVPVLDPKKYEWIKHAKPGSSAFDNQCINLHCRYQANPVHGTNRGHDGINRARKDTPLYCKQCGSLLPRPYTVTRDGEKRIMSGYTSAYKRMDPELPATALTRNLSYPCSDNKIHPFQNRVLSLAEALHLQTISDYQYNWGPLSFESGRNVKNVHAAPDSVMRLVIGESVPPRFLNLLGGHLKLLSFGSDLLEGCPGAVQDRQLVFW